MNALRRTIAYIGDSPTYDRDRANLISGGTIGVAGLLLNFAVLALVLPLMLDANDPDFRMLTENLEFGQLLALILLGGSTAFATLLIPLRMVTVFWGPRVGRYFDQIVLSGISPLRFVIGKATSQNLFLALILFLLLPYFVLSLTLGGVDPVTFAAGLFLVWLYCIALALVTLWAALYLNELLAALQVIVWAVNLSILGCIPIPYQPFMVTPFPALLQPVYASMPNLDGWSTDAYWPTFAACALGLTAVIGVSVFAIHLGPLFGIIRENSTFGEVVREGDSKRKRWSRLRQHIQRPSEIAFFYENRSAAFRRREGLLRWGLGFACLVIVATAAYGGFLLLMSKVATAGRWRWFVDEFHGFYLTIHGVGLLIAALLFSHSKNSTYLRVPLAFGRSAEVARLDTIGFLMFLLLTTAASLAIPYVFDHYWATKLGQTVFDAGQGRLTNLVFVAASSTLVISVTGLVVYTLHRLACLGAWIKFPTFAGIGMLYFIVVCVLPLMLFAFVNESRDLRMVGSLLTGTEVLAETSPFVVLMSLFGERGPGLPAEISTIPFYAAHAMLLVIALFVIQRRSPKVRAMYQDLPEPEAAQ